MLPPPHRVAGGGHLNRPIDTLITDSGLDLTRIENYYAQGPRPLGYIFEGAAVKVPPR